MGVVAPSSSPSPPSPGPSLSLSLILSFLTHTPSVVTNANRSRNVQESLFRTWLGSLALLLPLPSFMRSSRESLNPFAMLLGFFCRILWGILPPIRLLKYYPRFGWESWNRAPFRIPDWESWWLEWSGLIRVDQATRINSDGFRHSLSLCQCCVTHWHTDTHTHTHTHTCAYCCMYPFLYGFRGTILAGTIRRRVKDCETELIVGSQSMSLKKIRRLLPILWSQLQLPGAATGSLQRWTRPGSTWLRSIPIESGLD